MTNWYKQSGYGDAKGLQESIVPPCIAFFDVFGVDTESIWHCNLYRVSRVGGGVAADGAQDGLRRLEYAHNV